MPYINTTTLQYPLSERDVRAEFPNTSFPEPFPCPPGYAVVFPAPAPAYDPVLQYARETAPVLTDKGTWEQQWEVVDRYATQAEADAAVAAVLADAKAVKNSDINASRLQANRSEFEYGGKQFACDELSRGDIDGVNGYVALMGALPPGWPGGWKAVDNSYLPIANVDDWKGFYTAMVAAGNSHFAHAQALKNTLAAATTVAEVTAIVW